MKYLKIKAGYHSQDGNEGISYGIQTNMSLFEIIGMLEHIKRSEMNKRDKTP